MINEEKLKEFLKTKVLQLKNRKTLYAESLEQMRLIASTVLHDTSKVLTEANNVTMTHTMYSDLDMFLFQLCEVLGDDYTELLKSEIETDDK